MKKIIILIALLFLLASSADGKTTRFTKDRREQVQQRRDRIMQNGNIQNVYPKKFNIDWFVVNNRAYMGIFFNGGR